MGKKTRIMAIILTKIPLIYLIYWTFILPFVERVAMQHYYASYVYTHSIGMGLVMLISLTTNIILFITIYLSTLIRGKIHYFVISMIISDVLITVTTMPLEIYDGTKLDQPLEIQIKTLGSLKTHAILLKASRFFSTFSNVSYCTNFAMLCLIRLWRCLFCHRADVSLKLSGFLLAASWLYSVAVVVIHLLDLGIIWLDYALEFFIPIAVATTVFSCAFYTQRRISNLDGEENNIDSTAILVALMAAILLRGPYIAVVLLDKYKVFEEQFTLARLKVVTLNLFYLKCCVNLFVLGVLDSKYKESFANMLDRFQRWCLCYSSGVQISFKPSTEDVRIMGVDDVEFLIDTPTTSPTS